MRRWKILAAVVLFTARGATSAGQEPVPGAHGVVVSADLRASEAGLGVLRQGGTAVDAAVAVAFALAVTLPTAGNLGGGGFLVVHSGDGSVTTFDFREMAPSAAHRDLYRRPDGTVDTDASKVGHRASGVPGTVAGLYAAHQRMGKLPWSALLQPAIDLARHGFIVPMALGSSLASDRDLLSSFPGSAAQFFSEGRPIRAGERLVQRDLARTLERIASEGKDGFYRGETARLLAEEMKAGGGLITEEDLAKYQVKERPPVRGTYRGFEVLSMGPPSSGGVILIEMLNMLESAPLASLGPDSEERIHLMAEVMRRAFFDRSRFLGDTDFVSVPVKGLISPEYAATLRASITDKATPSKSLGESEPMRFERENTTHFSVMTADGAAVSCTTTLNGSFGSGVTVRGAGFLLNNEMDDFSVAPNVPNLYDLIQGEANCIEALKRPLSAMTPTLVRKDGKVVMVIGSPGGPTIINTVLQCLVRVLDDGHDIASAVAAPRFHHQWMPDRIDYEAKALPAGLRTGLTRRGHLLRERGSMGDAHGIFRDLKSGVLFGGADPRRGGVALGF